MKEEKTIFSQLQEALKDYEEEVEITDGYKFDMDDTINKIELYRASKFKSGDSDSQGNKKYFFNIINPQCGHATKNIDLDRKDIRVRAVEGKDRIKAMIYSAELKYWMRRENTGVLLNKISENLPIYGSVVLKKVGDKIKHIPLRYLKFDPAISNKENNFDLQSSYVIEEHHFQPAELLKMEAWDSDAITETIKKFRDNKDKDITIYEYYAEFPNEELGIKGNGYSLGVCMVAMGGTDKNNYEEVLYKEKLDKFPYKKVDYLRIEGRALGLGIVEMLLDPQQRWNEMANQKATSMKLSSKHLFQTRDTTVESNIMTDLLNGDIIKVNSEITPIANEERNLAAYRQEEANLLHVIRSLANAFEVVTGESLPSRTPFRLGAMMQQNAGKLFDFIRENLGMFLEETFKEWVLPQFEAEIVKEHIFELFDHDTIQLIVEKDVNRRLNEAIKRYVLSEGDYPKKEEVDILKEQLISQTEDTQFIKIIKGYLDFKKTIDIDITGEKTNMAAEIETISNLLQLLSQNPQIAQNPDLMKLLRALADRSGISPNLLPGEQGGGMQPSLGELASPAGVPGVPGMPGQVPLAK
jgi:hypothetical protein|tara:strand:- start:341 stop:2086 length:1746 start_codon:yes stop_codon:yes gene_type:complete